MHAPAAAEPANPFSRLLTQHAGWVLLAVAALTALALAQLVDWRSNSLRLEVDPSLDPLVARDDPARLFHERMRRRFGDDEAILVLVDSADAYSLDSLRRLDRLTRRFGDLPGVAEVTSLTTAPLARSHDNQVDFASLQHKELDDPALPARLRASVENNPLLLGQLVAADGRAAAILISLETQSDREILALKIASNITSAADDERAPGVQIYVTGAPIVRAATSAAVMEQLRRVIPAIALLLTLFLALSFRSVRGVLLPLATILVALLWTLAALSALGRPLNLITSLVPPLLVTMGLAYCAHMLSEFEVLSTDSSAPRRVVVKQLLREMAGPVLLTSMTTAVGLLAILLNDLPAIREFAWLSALGVFFTAVLVLGFIPAALCFSSPRAGRRLPGQKLFERSSERLGQFDMRQRTRILMAATAVFVAAVACSMQIRIGDQFVGIFPADTRVRADYEAVNRSLGGVNPLSVVIESPAADTFTDPAVLHELDRLQEWLKQQPEVGAVSGLVDHVKLTSRLLAGGGDNRIPESRDLIRQLLFFSDGAPLRGVVDGSRQSTQISMRLRVDDTSEVAALLERLEPRLEELPPALKAQVTGNAALMTQSVRKATDGQVQSIALSLLLVYLCLAIQFASFGVGFLASLPTLLQTALYFGALGLMGVKLNATTSLVECLVLGLAVDDTIHYLARFSAAARRTGSETSAAVSALSAVLRPVTLTKAMLALGFLMLITGELRNQVLFGWLAAMTLFAAWLVDIFVTPAFVSGVRIVTLWDSLRLNLGQDVETTIPLFAGMSKRQARIFALMSQMQDLPPGRRVISEGESPGTGERGDPQGDIYVVIDGELAVWIEREGQRVDLATLRRGAVVGETGYFGQKRTASVDTLTRVRLLRFDDADQERICRRYPKIAARVFLNLNRIQAERRSSDMHRVG